MRSTRIVGMRQLSSFMFAVFVFALALGLVVVVALGAPASMVSEFVGDRSIGAAGRTYIVQMAAGSSGSAVFTTEFERYSSILQSVKTAVVGVEAAVGNSGAAAPSFGPLHVYETVFHGFSAVLTEEEVLRLEAMPGVVGVYPDSFKQLHTTRTPEFLGLNYSQGLWPESHLGVDVIIGVLDSGVWPESNSFSDHRMPPVPARWKGACEVGQDFNVSLCNRKLIGARSFYKGYEAMAGAINESLEYKSPRDSDGHGTHTASTAAGRFVYRASLYGYAEGTAKGTAPLARVAVYKVCWAQGCVDSDILAAFDQAVADGVDILSLSLGGQVSPYYLDSIAIGTFGAAKRGVFTSASAGNSGPMPMSAANIAPWITTVGAGTIDRDFPANVVLGDGTVIRGVSLYSGPGLGIAKLSLVASSHAALIKSANGTAVAGLCMAGSLDPKLVAGKLVLCERGNNPRVAKGLAVLEAGGVGMILANAATDGEGLIADSHLLPATAVGYQGGNAILLYIRSSPNPIAVIQFQGTQLNIKPAPVVASFSSRGPNSQTPEILKPDLLAPGVNILAAWTGASGPTGLPFDQRRVKFNIVSGTSMSCPHVSGIAALLKGAHPDWSPAAIKSALMTSATVLDNSNGVLLDEATDHLSSPFDFGAGAVQPERAMDPGLVYDLLPQDYVNFLCALNYSATEVQVIDHAAPMCPSPAVSPNDLNYPSFSAILNQPASAPQSPSSSSSSSSRLMVATFSRTLTNVGSVANAVYRSRVVAPPGVILTVKPAMLVFSTLGEKHMFKLIVEVAPANYLLPGEAETMFGFLTWTDGTHVVQSPIAITRQVEF